MKVFTEVDRKELIEFIERFADASRTAANESEQMITSLKTCPLGQIMELAEKFEKILQGIVEKLEPR